MYKNTPTRSCCSGAERSRSREDWEEPQATGTAVEPPALPPGERDWPDYLVKRGLLGELRFQFRPSGNMPGGTFHNMGSRHPILWSQNPKP